MSVMDILSALEEGTRSILAVSIASACMGIVIGIVGITGFGLTLAGAILILNPNITHDLIGLGIVAAVLLTQAVFAKKEDNLRFAAI